MNITISRTESIINLCQSDISGSNSIQNSNGSNTPIFKLANIKQYAYKYSFLEKQCKNQLEIKSRFVINIFWNNNKKLKWKQLVTRDTEGYCSRHRAHDYPEKRALQEVKEIKYVEQLRA